MQTETLVYPAKTWLEERPALAKEQLHDPRFAMVRAVDELGECLVEVDKIPMLGTNITWEELRELIKDEWTDVLNFIACAEFALVQEFGFTEEELLERSNFKYGIRNHVKYPKDGYGEESTLPAEEQLRTDANMWYFAQAYLGSPWNANPEYY
jgi:hypothetical protein